MYKKVVVVVEEKEIYFSDYEDLVVINKGKRPISSTTMKVSKGFGVEDEEPMLILRAKIDGQNDVIAVFKKWDYWREIAEDKTQATQAPLTSSEKEVIKAELRKDRMDYRENIMETVLSNLTNDQLTAMRNVIARLTVV